jgi:predicted TPR repeat methyltransferase
MPNVYQFKDFEGSSHRILLSLVRRSVPAGARLLLDLGAAGGELGAELRDRFQKTIGFEYDADRIGQLRQHFDSVVIANLETVPRLPRNVDVIVLADVLEHLRNQREVLQRVREALAPGGLLFISVPNIANITIRLGLLFGIFQYRDRGILDETHVRFYTVRTIRQEMENAGFEISSVHGSSVPIRLIVDGHVPEFLIRIGERMLSAATAVWKALFAYQIIMVARVADRSS